MTLQIRTIGCTIEPEIRESIRQEVATTFRRVHPSIDRIRVRLADLNGPRGGADKEVRLEVGLRGARNVIVAQRGASWMSALHTATQRAWQSTMRRIDRRKDRQTQRTSPREIQPISSAALDHDREELF